MEMGFLDGLMFCSHCRKDMRVRLSSDIGVTIRWVDVHILFSVLLLLSRGVGSRSLVPFILYREVYTFR